MPMEGALPNFFTINGKAYPATETVNMRVGEHLLIRFIGSNGAFVHPMHVHGGPFRIVETDGNPVPEAAQIEKDTVNVGPGERYDVIWTAREPGRWLLHCHILHHTTNNNVEERGGGGLTMVLDVS
jgi:FtsP/CotA-like multicopper oxidase with cupredoxin domain